MDRRGDALLLRKIEAVVRGHGSSGASSGIVYKSLPVSGRRRYNESHVKRILSENSSKWFGHKPFVRTQNIASSGKTAVYYVSRTFLDCTKSVGECYLTGQKRFAYQILGARFSHSRSALLLQAALPFCLSEIALRKCLTGRRRGVMRTGVVVIQATSRKEKVLDGQQRVSDVQHRAKSHQETPTANGRRVDGARREIASNSTSKQSIGEKSGWLEKRGGNFFHKTWHQRYVVLKDSTLLYKMNNNPKERSRGTYAINRDCSVQHAERESSVDHPNTFKVKGRRFELLFAAKTALEEQSWIDAIRNAITRSGK